MCFCKNVKKILCNILNRLIFEKKFIIKIVIEKLPYIQHF